MDKIDLQSVLKLNETVTLNSLPNKRNGIWKKIPDLKLGDKFIFLGIASDKNNLLFKHVQTGFQFILSPILFLDNDRFYNGSRIENKTALYILFDYEMFPYQGVDRKSITARLGTIFPKFEKHAKGYLVYPNSGKPYFIPKYAGFPLSDVLKIDEDTATEKPVVGKKEPKDKIVAPTINFERRASLNGFMFSSLEVSEKVEKEVTKLLSLSLEDTDKENMLLLALDILNKGKEVENT